MSTRCVTYTNREMNIAVESVSHRQIVDTGKFKRHFDYLDGLRSLAAIYVVIHHAMMQVDTKELDNFVIKFIVAIFHEGRYAVDLFIVISGFCLMLPVTRNNIKLPYTYNEFIKKRVKRILPTYYLALLFSLLLIYLFIGNKTGTHWDASIPVNGWDLASHIFLIQDLFGETWLKINHCFWSISVEWRIYFFFPALVYFFKRWGSLTTTLLTIPMSVFLWYVLAGIHLNFYAIAPHYFSLFSFGMLANQSSLLNENIPINKKIILFWCLKAYVFTALILLLIQSKYTLNLSSLILDFIVGSLGASLLTIVASGRFTGLYRLLSWRPLVFIGTFSYSIYLVHAPLLQIISQYILLPLHTSPLISIVFFVTVGLPLIIASSYLFFLVAERPFISKTNRLKVDVKL